MILALLGLLAVLFAAKLLSDKAEEPPPAPISTPQDIAPTTPADARAPGAPVGEPLALPAQPHTNESLHEAQELEKRRMGIVKILPPGKRREEPAALPGKTPALLTKP